MPHQDEKGRISPAQSKVARGMRNPGANPHYFMGDNPKTWEAHHKGKSTPLSRRTMTQMAESHGSKEGRHAYGERHYGVSGMSRMAHLKEVNKDKKSKSRVVLRGQKSERRKAYTKIGKRMHVKGLLHVPKVEE